MLLSPGQDIEPSRSIRRYIGLRSTTPNPRKSQRARAAEAERPFQQGGVVLRANKDIVGFVLAEYDFLIGSLFLAVVVPWGTADTFDATTRMLVALIARVEEDLREMNEFNERTGVARLPEVKQIWTLMFFKRESRMMAHLEKKRGFVPLNEYLAKWVDSSAAEFAPERECYIPRERKWRPAAFFLVCRPANVFDCIVRRRANGRVARRCQAAARRGRLDALWNRGELGSQVARKQERAGLDMASGTLLWFRQYLLFGASDMFLSVGLVNIGF